jgi:site-specific DNA recombinase
MVGTKAHGANRYRCTSPKTRALPDYLADHPKSRYVREDAVVTALDSWLATLANPEWLAATQEPDSTVEAQYETLRSRLAELDKTTRNLVAAIEAGTDPAVVNPRLAQLRAEREQLSLRFATLEAPDRLSPADIEALFNELGGLARILGEATPPERTSIYQGLGLDLVYQPDQPAIVATADLGRVLSRVGGATRHSHTRQPSPSTSRSATQH